MTEDKREWWILINPAGEHLMYAPYEFAYGTEQKEVRVVPASRLEAAEAKLAEVLSCLPKIPTEPYEKRLAQKLALATEALERIANITNGAYPYLDLSEIDIMAREALEKLK